MKRLLLLSFLSVASMSTYAQEKQNKTHRDTTKEETPKGNWTVTKEYDEDGNLIAKDSIYSYSWSSSDINMGEITPEDLNEMMESFRQQLPEGFMDDLKSWSDSIFKDDLTQDFYDGGEMREEDLDSLFNHFRGRMPSEFENLIPEDFNLDEFRRSFFEDSDMDSFRERIFEQFQHFQNQFAEPPTSTDKKDDQENKKDNKPMKNSSLQRI